MTVADTIVVRPLRAEDVERLFEEPARRALCAEWLERQERGELYVVVAEVDGVPIGRICLDFTSYAEERIGYFFAAGVRPEWRLRGIATTMHRHLEQVALARGCRALRSVAEKVNPGAVRWHERCGDRLIGEGLVRWTEPDGREVEADCWKFECGLGAYRDSPPDAPET